MPHAPAPSRTGWFPQLLLRLHFLAGLFVGPFILVAALSGAVYAMAPTIEQAVYRHELTAPSSGAALPLADQVAAAQRHLDARHPDDTVTEVRPAPAPGTTTRVMFHEDGLGESRTRAVFVDPGDASVRGDLPVYGTSGSLPFRTWISTLHRSLFLGDVGRLYSETAASWLSIVSLAGIGLWTVRIRSARRKRELVVPTTGLRGYRRTTSWHAATGVWLLVGALFLSATGITWSHFAGDTVSALRSSLDWRTPTVDTALDGAPAPTSSEHAGHHGGAGSAVEAGPAVVTDEQYDEVLEAARATNVDAAEVRILVPSTAGQAWTVEENKQSWPVAVDAVAIDPADMSAVSRADWAEYPAAAKLAELGINTHMGVLWGLPNQVVLLFAALGIAAVVVFGYAMWWQRRPPGSRVGRAPAAGALARAPWWGTTVVVVGAVGIGVLLPTVGVTLLGFLLVDALIVTVGATRTR